MTMPRTTAAQMVPTKTGNRWTLSDEMKAAGILSVKFHDNEQNVFICDVDLGKTAPDMSYQRDHDDKHSTSLANRRIVVYPYPILSFRNNRLNTTDGQHRVEKRKKEGKRTGLCMVKFGLTVQVEAGLYSNLQHAKRPNPWNWFKADLTARDRKHVEMQKIAHRAGLSLKCEGKQGDLTNTSPMHESYDANLYGAWVELLAECFKNEGNRLDKPARGVEFQRGLLDVLRIYGADTITADRVKSALREIGANLIQEQAADICDCARTNRNHYMRAIQSLLILRGVISEPLADVA
jgi:hypothetical protein